MVHNSAHVQVSFSPNWSFSTVINSRSPNAHSPRHWNVKAWGLLNPWWLKWGQLRSVWQEICRFKVMCFTTSPRINSNSAWVCSDELEGLAYSMTSRVSLPTKSFPKSFPTAIVETKRQNNHIICLGLLHIHKWLLPITTCNLKNKTPHHLHCTSTHLPGLPQQPNSYVNRSDHLRVSIIHSLANLHPRRPKSWSCAWRVTEINHRRSLLVVGNNGSLGRFLCKTTYL